ncbi:MAG: 2-phospho-L-lactate transferase CofD family protein [Thermomicrobiales bacterium]
MIVALAGGVGGAKMAHGLALAADPQSLTVVVNTADDFDHLGLRICPDLDTVMYTLGGVANPLTGWGIANDSRTVLDAIVARGGPDWFWLGDQDFATHILRTEALRNQKPLSEVMSGLCAGFGIRSTILPMSDDPVATMVTTRDGELTFQEYFVRRQQRDEVTAIHFAGVDRAVALPDALMAIRSAQTIVLTPSNPIVSIGPILAIDGFVDALRSTEAARVAHQSDHRRKGTEGSCRPNAGVARP